MPDGPTKQTPVDVERFKGIRAPLHKRHSQRGILLAEPRQCKFPEVDTTWYGQQPVCDWPNPSPHIKAQASSKRGYIRGLDGGRHPIGIAAVSDPPIMTLIMGYLQVLKEGE